MKNAEAHRSGLLCHRTRHRDSGQAAELCIIDATREKSAAARLVEVGQIAQRLIHPNLVRVYDCGMAEHLAFVTVEGRSGVTLQDRISQNGKMSVEVALAWLEECARGLAAAHNTGVIHGSIDPTRIVLTPKGEAKIDGLYSGFLSAARVPAAKSRNHADEQFAAPEQISGNKKQLLSPSADLYALASCFLFAVSGKALSKAKDPSAPSLQSVCSTASERLSELIARCHHREIGSRLGDATELLGALEGATRGGAEEDASLQSEWDEEMSWAAREKKKSSPAASSKKSAASTKQVSAKTAKASAANRIAAPTAAGEPAFDVALFGDEEQEVPLPVVKSPVRVRAMKRWISVLIAAAVLISILLVALPSGRDTVRYWFAPDHGKAPSRTESTESLFARAITALEDPLRVGQAEHLLTLVVARDSRFPAARSKLAEARTSLAHQCAEKGLPFDALRWSERAIEVGQEPQAFAAERDRWIGAASEELLHSLLLERCEWNRDGSRVRFVGRIGHKALQTLSFAGQKITRDATGRFDAELKVRSLQDGIELEGDYGVRALRELTTSSK